MFMIKAVRKTVAPIQAPFSASSARLADRQTSCGLGGLQVPALEAHTEQRLMSHAGLEAVSEQ
jgi:hypothetical protein